MGDPSIDVTEENRDASQEAKSKAMEAMSEGALFSPHPFGLFFFFFYLACLQSDSPLHVALLVRETGRSY